MRGPCLIPFVLILVLLVEETGIPTSCTVPKLFTWISMDWGGVVGARLSRTQEMYYIPGISSSLGTGMTARVLPELHNMYGIHFHGFGMWGRGRGCLQNNRQYMYIYIYIFFFLFLPIFMVLDFAVRIAGASKAMENV